jgi:hypothetical protein
VGRDKVIDLVTQAYNTELLSTMLSRLEQINLELWRPTGGAINWPMSWRGCWMSAT